ncbi:hypothetical protein LF65_06910 [Clostridium beijerinckii]|uniref:Uncharacterized protein n=1 Tax=Clostridium beijerinckii TaxID=1520 RepID=A0A140DMK7_CLOBE|nr:hypothetical protein [Clostridium beijerinckii]AMK50502.1 hypothetical protein LF65_06910 [Clostridium beijerinckii]
MRNNIKIDILGGKYWWSGIVQNGIFMPYKMIDTLHKMGFKVILWVCNFISPDSLTSRNLGKKDCLIKIRRENLQLQSGGIWS